MKIVAVRVGDSFKARYGGSIDQGSLRAGSNATLVDVGRLFEVVMLVDG
jgi:hypothetical protein